MSATLFLEKVPSHNWYEWRSHEGANKWKERKVFPLPDIVQPQKWKARKMQRYFSFLFVPCFLATLDFDPRNTTSSFALAFPMSQGALFGHIRGIFTPLPHFHVVFHNQQFQWLKHRNEWIGRSLRRGFNQSLSFIVRNEEPRYEVQGKKLRHVFKATTGIILED